MKIKQEFIENIFCFFSYLIDSLNLGNEEFFILLGKIKRVKTLKMDDMSMPFKFSCLELFLYDAEVIIWEHSKLGLLAAFL